MASLAALTIAEARELLRGGEVSSRRITEDCLAAIEAAGALNAFVHVTAEKALAMADDADRRRAAGEDADLLGIPLGIKDVYCTAGVQSQAASKILNGFRPPYESTVTARLWQAGAVMLGKLNMDEFAMGSSTEHSVYGACVSPWRREGDSAPISAGGSSGGSAAAVAAGMCSFALGTETYGSIVAPATRCGAVGLRPSFGRVARTGTMALCPSLDKIGPIARSVADAALVLAAIDGADRGDAASIQVPFGGDLGAAGGIRVGHVEADFAAEGAHRDDRAMLDLCRDLGFTVVACAREDLPYDSLVSILMAEAAASFETLTLDDRDDMLARQDAEAWPNQFRAARFLSAVDHVQLDRLRRRAMLAMDRLFETVDVLIGPSLAGPMPLATNMTGHPCLCLPAGFTERDGRRVPRSISLWGRLFDEGRLLAAGCALERRLGLDLRPDAATMERHMAGGR
jgi:Asp-tRNA(Asn)/Glu-tRNA(Gln) amidotransferase A subunit family amidase